MSLTKGFSIVKIFFVIAFTFQTEISRPWVGWVSVINFR